MDAVARYLLSITLIKQTFVSDIEVVMRSLWYQSDIGMVLFKF